MSRRSVATACRTTKAAWLGWALLALAPVAAAADGQLKSENWSNDNRGFEQFARRIEADHPRNLLARKAVRVHAKQRGVDALADGDAGERGGDGRVNVDGRPTVITYYLGAPKPIHRIGMFTYNGDMRANQDYEVYVADNSSRPGKMPTFGDKPTFTTGP